MHMKSSVNIHFFFFFFTIHCKIDVYISVIGTNHSSLHGAGSAKDRRVQDYCGGGSFSCALGWPLSRMEREGGAGWERQFFRV